MKSLLLVLAVGLAATVVSVAPAAARTPCAQAVINDWFDNGKVDKRYAPECYREAIRTLPQDVDTYSSAKEDIQRALLAVLRGHDSNGGSNNKSGSTGGGEPDRHVSSSSGTSDTPSPTSDTPSAEEKPSKGIIRSTIEWLGPSDAASVPLPLLILAGIAFLLLAAAGGSFVNRRLQARRLPPPPA